MVRKGIYEVAARCHRPCEGIYGEKGIYEGLPSPVRASTALAAATP